MRPSIPVAVAVLLAIASAAWSARSASLYPPHVIPLTSANWTETLSTGDWFLAITASWCVFSKRIGPQLDELADKLHRNRSVVNVASIDGSVETGIAGGFSVTSFPALFLIHDGKVLLYKGEHTAASMFEVISYNADPSKRKLGWELPVAKASYVRQLQFDLYNWIQQTLSNPRLFIESALDLPVRGAFILLVLCAPMWLLVK